MRKEEGKILVVDDDESVLLMARYLLSQRFSNVITISDPSKIKTIPTKNEFDVALLDMNYTASRTTGQEGFDLLNYFIQNAPAVRVILMTAYSDMDLAIKAIKEGADDFIVKPWDNTKFLNIVTTLVRKGPKRIPEPFYPLRHGNMHKTGEHISTEMDRVFMFLDLNSATTIAEKLGHQRYFEFLQDFYEDIAEPIRLNEGEIYQYVGDEVVVSWPLDKGVAGGRCLQCFFDIEDTIARLSEVYSDNYGLVPGFKAGMHCGKVVTGVVGTYKKEKVYTGDVLNTTSRIVGQCNPLKVKLLLSGNLKEKIHKTEKCEFTMVGEIIPRGKRAEVKIYTCRRPGN